MAVSLTRRREVDDRIPRTTEDGSLQTVLSEIRQVFEFVNCID